MAHLSHVHSGLITPPIHTLGFAITGTHTVAQWPSCPAPDLSLAEYRQTRLRQLLSHAAPHNVTAVAAIFRQAYAWRITAFMVGGKYHG